MQECYLADERLLPLFLKKPYSVGIYLGREKKEFEASVALLDLLKSTKRKMVINEKAEWLFLCGRDVMAESMVSCPVNEGKVIVCNERDEVLGLGIIMDAPTHSARPDIAAKNILHKGWYLGK